MRASDPGSGLGRLLEPVASIDPVASGTALLVGLALGALFFAGLLWTVRRGLTSTHPALLFLTSLLLRTTLVVAGILWTTGGAPTQVVVCLSGFLIARVIVMRLASRDRQEVRDAAQS